MEAAAKADHEARTLTAVRTALTSVPFYAKQNASVPDADLATTLGQLPLLTREKIRPTLPKAWLPEARDAKAELASGAISVIDNGTGDARVRLLFDAAWWRAQEKAALAMHPRAAAALRGEMGPYREAALWVPERGTGSCGAGDPEMDERIEGVRLHLNTRQDPTFWTESVMTRMLDELANHGTVGLLADPSYLDVLARHAAVLGRRLDVRGFVALTRALTTIEERRAIGKVFPGTSFQVYAAREAGTLFVEGADGLLHHSPHAAHVELLPLSAPTPGAEHVAMVVVTTIGREVQPLVRYVLGDLVRVAAGVVGPTGVPAVASVEGRLDDAIVRPDGALVTPGALDRAVGPIGARAYQAVQREPGAVEIDVVGGDAEAVRAAARPLFEGMNVTARSATAIGMEPNGKLRTSKRAASIHAPSVEVKS